MRRHWLAAVVAVIVGACAGTPPVTSVPDWTQPAIDFFASLGAAFDRGDVDMVLAHYQPDASLTDAAVGLSVQGWRQMGDVIGRVNEGSKAVFGQTFLAPERAAVVLEQATYGPSSGCGSVSCSDAVANLFLIDDGLITRQERMHASDDPALVELYRDVIEAWNSHDVDRILAGFSKASFAPDPREVIEQNLADFPEIRFLPRTLEQAGLEGGSAPAVFNGGSRPGSARSREAMGIYGLELKPGVSTEAVLWWDLWDSEILGATTLFDPAGWGSIVEGTDATVSGTLWFSTIQTPIPVDETVTATLLTSGGPVDVFGGDEAIVALFDWAFARFDEAGLGAPVVGGIHVETSLTCRSGSGWAATGETVAEVRICLDPSEIGPVGSPSLVAKFTALHELAHVWNSQHLDDAVTARFMAQRGLEVWSDGAVAWPLQANEQAAEFIGWGLLDDPIELVRIPDPGCRGSVELFRLLTGSDPLTVCES